ncbi:hypothetical protein [Nostoc sp. MS1]|uniref:hypothetical protein n=1 Tax=Nostoc sp. MS1 TaxID=2764711 RepID=UPI001CC4DC70|nr:hypothetical protein [Nostoc sp. MS1]BCL33578.1 hypothetical protein NSMS1_00250 [Nostoc sp. MS1]
MSSEELFLKKWRSLSQDKQEQVLVFIDFLCWQDVPNKSSLEKRLQEIRNYVINYGRLPDNNPEFSE